MKFDIVSRIYYMKMSTINNIELFTRDAFSTVNATYNKANDTYTILKERNEFKTKKNILSIFQPILIVFANYINLILLMKK